MKYGRYNVVAEIGRGSMGVVYKAHDPQIDRLVALKVLRQDRVSSDDYVKRFVKEATAVGRLSHPGIVTVFDIGQDHGTVYIAMELLEGTPLDELFKAGRVGVDQAIEVGRRVAEALHYAHRKGIVHRDIKPANIICSDSGQVKVTDFGIAHIDDPDGQQMTQAGEILGTPVYMSPEQVTGQPVDGRSDVYSLGVILYELTTGERPFKGKNLGALFNAITGAEVVEPMGVNPEVPPWLSRVIMKTMARDPADRYTSGAGLAAAMEPPSPAGVQPSGGRKKRSGMGRMVFLLLLLCSLAGGLYFLALKQIVPGLPTPDSVIASISARLQKKDDSSAQDEHVPATKNEESVADTAQKDTTQDDRAETVLTPEEAAEPVQIVADEVKIKNIVREQAEHAGVAAVKSGGEETAPDQVVADEKTLDEPDPAMDEIFDNPAFVKENEDEHTIPVESTLPSFADETVGLDKEQEHFPEDWTLMEDRSPPEVTSGVAGESRVQDVQQVQETTVVPTRTVDPVEKTTVASLPPQPKEDLNVLALLNLTSRPEGARIYVDGEYRGKTPYKEKLSAKKHEITLQLDGYGDWKGQLDLSRGDMKSPLSVRLFAK